MVVLLPVVSELLQRATDPRSERLILATVHEAVAPQRRIAPDGGDWCTVGRTVAAMAAAGHDPAELRRRSFHLDVLLAVMCRARGITFVTNDADHARIRAHVGHAVDPFPA